MCDVEQYNLHAQDSINLPEVSDELNSLSKQ